MNEMDSKRLQLPTVTLCAADTRSPILAIKALKRCMEQVDFAQVILFTHQVDLVIQHDGIRIEAINPFTSAADYSKFILAGLIPWIDSSHVLIAQWDGFIVNANAWRDDFLTVDYLGAPWGKAPNGFHVGNGGFSLRSRKLLAALDDVQLKHNHPEDICICQTNREFLEKNHGIKFASLAQAQQFSFENEIANGPTFGFHGLYNFPLSMTSRDLHEWLRILPPSIIRSRDALKAARKMIAVGYLDQAKYLLQARQNLGVWSAKEQWIRFTLSRFN